MITPYRTLLYHSRTLQSTHMLYSDTPYSPYPRTRWFLPINVRARLDGYPAVRRVYSALFGACAWFLLDSINCLWAFFRRMVRVSQPKKINKKQKESIFTIRCITIYRSNLEQNKFQSSQKENKERKKNSISPNYQVQISKLFPSGAEERARLSKASQQKGISLTPRPN